MPLPGRNRGEAGEQEAEHRDAHVRRSLAAVYHEDAVVDAHAHHEDEGHEVQDVGADAER